MNRCVFVGRVVNDPEVRTTANGTATCSFRIAVQRRFKNANGERQSDFFQCVAWRQTAEYVGRFFHKGDMIAVEGEMQNRDYQAQDGTKRYVTELIIDNAHGCGNAQSKPADVQGVTAAAQEVFGAGFVEVDDEGLPF